MHVMRGHNHRVEFKGRRPEGVRALTDSLDLESAPVLQTTSACKSGMAFLELASRRENLGITEPFRDDAFLIALQLEAYPDFDLYEDGRLIRPREFDAGAIAIFDLRTNLAMDRRDPFHAVDLYIPRKSLDALAEDANSPAIDELRHEPGKALRDPIARHLLMAIRPALSAPGQASELFVDHIAMALATHVAHTYGGMRARSEAKMGTLAYWQERRAKELLAANLAGNVTLADLAKACELSIRHFTRAFRGSTGMSPHAWLLDLRMEKAKHLLASSRRMLADIALDCGFADQSHLTRAFQRSVGLTPGAWRRLHQR
jgi:AraC family transcriptional regulator